MVFIIHLINVNLVCRNGKVCRVSVGVLGIFGMGPGVWVREVILEIGIYEKRICVIKPV